MPLMRGPATSFQTERNGTDSVASRAGSGLSQRSVAAWAFARAGAGVRPAVSFLDLVCWRWAWSAPARGIASFGLPAFCLSSPLGRMGLFSISCVCGLVSYLPLDRARALPPLRAMDERCEAVSDFARAGPPFLPPRSPSVTAARLQRDGRLLFS